MSIKGKKRIITLPIIIELVLIILVVGCIGFYFVHRVINNRDAKPVITITDESNEFSVSATEDDFLKGVKADDREDGNVTNSVIIESISQLIDGKKRTITYVAFDSHNNVTKLDRDIVYTDYAPPRFTSKASISVKRGTSEEILAKLSAEDVIDGDVSDQIRIEINNVQAGIPGKYPARVSVTNSCGDVTTKDIVVTVTGEED